MNVKNKSDKTETYPMDEHIDTHSLANVNVNANVKKQTKVTTQKRIKWMNGEVSEFLVQ
jgi:hypothetical protein